MSRTPVGYMSWLVLLLSPTFVAATCDGPLSIGGDGAAAGSSNAGSGAKAGTSNTGGRAGKSSGGATSKGGTSGESGDTSSGSGGANTSAGTSAGSTNAGGKANTGGATSTGGKANSAGGTSTGGKANSAGAAGNPAGTTEFQCADGTKIVIYPAEICDGKEQCPDKSDEAGCPGPSSSIFLCNDEKVLDGKQVCDQVRDCGDGADELSCPYVAEADRFICRGGRWISNAKECDGLRDCLNGSDEIDCSSFGSDVFICRNKSKIVAARVCDQVPDCADQSDEESCVAAEKPFVCAEPSATLVNYELACDGDQDCPDGSDELDCPPPGTVSCHDGTAIQDSVVCDSNPDCPDESDERFCSPNLVPCTSGVETAHPYDGERQCFLPPEPIGCSERFLPPPQYSVPREFSSAASCVKRRSDGRIFSVLARKSELTFEECPAEVVAVFAATPLCE